jgi:23S rRNA (uridine2552-2'-O)-methyltransferase
MTQTRDKKQKVKTAYGRKLSSTRWLQRHINDPYVEQAKKERYRSRAAYKLLEVEEKFRILSGVSRIIDLGAAPGSWSQVVKRKHASAHIVGVDLQSIDEMPGITFIQGDFCEQEIQDRINEVMPQMADLIISDMAANACGDRQIDHLRIVGLIEAAYEFAQEKLVPGGAFVAKLLRGGEEPELLKKLRVDFTTVKLFKPKASYSDSAEIFLICTGFRGREN